MLLTRSNFDAQAFGGCHLGKDTGESMVHEPFAQLKTWAYTCHAYREFSAEVFLRSLRFFWHKRVEKKCCGNVCQKCLALLGSTGPVSLRRFCCPTCSFGDVVVQLRATAPRMRLSIWFLIGEEPSYHWYALFLFLPWR